MAQLVNANLKRTFVTQVGVLRQQDLGWVPALRLVAELLPICILATIQAVPLEVATMALVPACVLLVVDAKWQTVRREAVNLNQEIPEPSTGSLRFWFPLCCVLRACLSCEVPLHRFSMWVLRQHLVSMSWGWRYSSSVHTSGGGCGVLPSAPSLLLVALPRIVFSGGTTVADALEILLSRRI